MTAAESSDAGTVMVTGVGGGIGAAVALAFAAAGADVVALDLASVSGAGRDLERQVSDAGVGRLSFIAADITDGVSVRSAVSQTLERFGGVGVLVNAAAIYRTLSPRGPWDSFSEDEFDLVMRVNVRGTWQVISAVAPVMRQGGGGSIINFSSASARTGVTGFPHYVASKAAVDGLTRAAAREFGPDGIRVNAVAPGLVSNESTRERNNDSYVAAAAASRSISREMTPEDVIGAIQWLASPAAAFVTGQILIVDGGQTFN